MSPRSSQLTLGLASLAFVLAGASARSQCPGAPNLAPAVMYAFSGSGPVTGIANADMDGDGDLDLVAVQGPNIVVLRNGGAGTFSPESPIPTGITTARALTVGDFDEDGRPDVAVAGHNIILTTQTNITGHVVVLLNSTLPGPVPVSFFSPAAIPFGAVGPSGSVGRAIKNADLNADGIVDLVVVDQNSQNIWVLLGQGSLGLGNGALAAPVPYAVFSTGTTDVAISDYNQDGAADLAVISSGCACPSVLRLLNGVVGPGGLPTGTFGSTTFVPVPALNGRISIEAVDVNADGIRDLVMASDTTIEVALGGAGGFVVTTYPAGTFPEDLAVGDVTGDGIVDIAAARNCPIGSGNGNFSILAGIAAGGFVGYTNLAFNTGFPQCITAADFNGDGMLDVASGKGIASVDVRLNNCAAAPLNVAVTYPVGGPILNAGSPMIVTWTKTVSVALVDVDVSRNGGASWERIESSVSGTSLVWTVTEPATTNAFVRVMASGIPSVTATSAQPFTIVGGGGATSISIGSGCSPIGAPPVLTIGPPVLGTNTLAVVSGAGASVIGGIWVSVPASPTVVAPGCSVYLDIPGAILINEFFTNGAGSWSQSYPIPGLNALVGLVVRLQSATVLPGFVVQLTNAVELTFGY